MHEFLGKGKDELLRLRDEAIGAGDKIKGRLIHDHLVGSHGWSPDQGSVETTVPEPAPETVVVPEPAETVTPAETPETAAEPPAAT